MEDGPVQTMHLLSPPSVSPSTVSFASCVPSHKRTSAALSLSHAAFPARSWMIARIPRCNGIDESVVAEQDWYRCELRGRIGGGDVVDESACDGEFAGAGEGVDVD
jgi:hypothetical protein